VWARDGHITLTPGASVDYELIERFVAEDQERHVITRLHYDPWNANATRGRLEGQGLPMVEFTQNLKNYNEPAKEFARLVLEGLLHHGGHPVLAWCAENVEVYTDASGNIRPVKPEDESANRIDGITAGIMALAGVMGGAGGSVYEDRGVMYAAEIAEEEEGAYT